MVVKYYNMQPSSSRGNFSPMEINTGVSPSGWIAPLPIADRFDHRDDVWRMVLEAREEQNDIQAQKYDQSRVDVRYAQGDLVHLRYLSEPVENGNYNLSPLFMHTMFKVVRVLSEVSYVIRNIAPTKQADLVVHVSQLAKAAFAETDLPQEEGVFEVLRILTHKGSADSLQYLVEWRGYKNSRQRSWLTRPSLLQSASEILSRYESLFPEVIPNKVPPVALLLPKCDMDSRSCGFTRKPALDWPLGPSQPGRVGA